MVMERCSEASKRALDEHDVRSLRQACVPNRHVTLREGVDKSSHPVDPHIQSRYRGTPLSAYIAILLWKGKAGNNPNESIRTDVVSSITTRISPAGVLLRLRIACENDLAELHPNLSPLSSL